MVLKAKAHNFSSLMSVEGSIHEYEKKFKKKKKDKRKFKKVDGSVVQPEIDSAQ